MKDISLTTLLGQRGLRGEAADAVLRALQEAGLTRAGKQRIVESKVEQGDALIQERFLRVCTGVACQPAAGEAGERTVVTVPKEHCEVCEGSASAHAVQRMAAVLLRAGFRRLLVVGGTENARQEMVRLLPRDIDVRFILNDVSMNLKSAGEAANWADVVAIWGSTPIDHKVTKLFERYERVTVPRRGIVALAEEVRRHVEGRKSP